MYGLKVYITPEDIIEKFSDEDKERFNQCVFTNVAREADGSITNLGEKHGIKEGH